MAKMLEYNATLIERVDMTSALASFKIRPDEPYEGDDPFFVPGQYVTIGLNNEENPDLGSVRRPMSIASAPEERAVFELYIRYVKYPESDNPLTHLLWKAKEGDRIYLKNKAVGRFTLDHTVGADDERHKICVAAGTGLAPFVSMVRSDHLRLGPQGDLSKWVVLHGASYPSDLGYREELEGYRDAGIHYFMTVSRPHRAPEWPGDTGRVEDYFLPEKLVQLEERLDIPAGNLNPNNAVIFICGLTGTIGRTIERLVERGFVPENKKLRRALEVEDDVAPSLFFEQYDTEPVIAINDPQVIGPLRSKLKEALASL